MGRGVPCALIATAVAGRFLYILYSIIGTVLYTVLSSDPDNEDDETEVIFYGIQSEL